MSTQQPKESDRIYNEWYQTLDPIDQELVEKVAVTDDDDYPFEVFGTLSRAARERGGFYHSEVGWTVIYRPFPPESFYQALKEEQEVQRQQEQDQYNAVSSQAQQEKHRMDSWMAVHLTGLHCVSRYLPTTLHPKEQSISFATGSFGTGVRFTLALFEGHPVWMESYGNAVRYYMSWERANQTYQQLWEAQTREDRSGLPLLHALSRYLSGCNAFGDDLYQWLVDAAGEEYLVSVAQSCAPIPIGRRTDLALASKYYRILVQMEERYPSTELVVGYGDATLNRGPAQSLEIWERDVRLHGWVPEGEEDNPLYSFPDEEDIAEVQKQYQDYSQFFSDFFG